MSGNFGEELGGFGGGGSGGSDTDTDTNDTDDSGGFGGGGSDTDSEDTGGPPEDDGFDPSPPSNDTSSGGSSGGLLDDEIDSSVGNESDSDSSSSSDFGEELGAGQSTSGGSDTDSNQTDSGGSGGDSSGSDSGSDSDSSPSTDIGGDDLQSGTDPTAGGDSTDTNQTDSGGSESDSDGSDSGGGSSSPGEFPTPEEVNETVQESDTTQQDTDLTDTSSGDVTENFSEDTEATPTGEEAPEQDDPTLQNTAGVDNFGQFVGQDISNARDVFISNQAERIASQNENVQASEIDSISLEETENGYQVVATVDQAPVFTNTTGTGFGGGRGRPGGPPVDVPDVPDRRTTEVAETGTAGDVQITRDETQRTIDTSQVSSIGLGSNATQETGTEAREQTKEEVTSQFQDQLDREGVNYNVSEDDVEVVRVGNTLTASLKDDTRQEVIRQQAFQNIKEETGESVSPENIRVTETEDGSYRAELTEEGKTELAAKGAPLANVPIVGNITQGSAALTSIANRKVVQPTAGFVGEAFESTPVILPTGVGGLASSPEATAGKRDSGFFDTEPETAAGTATQKLTQGAGTLATTPLSLPVLAGTAVEVGGEAAQFTAENPRQAPGAAVGATTQYAIDTANTIKNNPLKTTGALIASAGIFGAAKRLGPGASTATRYTIQPGEELLGAGLNRVPRIGNRIAPNSEPIFFSEEAAIRLGKAGGRRAKQVGGTLKNRLPETKPIDVETETETVADVEGEVEGENTGVETDTETETEIDTETSTETETVDATVTRERTVIEPQPTLPGPRALAEGTLRRGEQLVEKASERGPDATKPVNVETRVQTLGSEGPGRVERVETEVQPQPALPGPQNAAEGFLSAGAQTVGVLSGRGPELTEPFTVRARARTVGSESGGRIESVETEVEPNPSLPGPRTAADGFLTTGAQTVGVLSGRTPDVDMPRNIETRTRTVAQDGSFNLITATEADLRTPNVGSTARNRAADVANAARREIARFRFEQPARRTTGERSELIEPDTETVAVVEDGEVQGYIRTTETEGETDTQTDTDLPESEREGDATDAETGTVETEQDVGGGQRQIREQRLGESESGVSRTERTGTGTDRPTRRFEVADQPPGTTETPTEPTLGFDEVTGTVAESAGRQDTSTGLGIDQTPELGTGLENPPSEVTVPGVELGLGTETEIENENRQETRIESETESEVEQRLESRREIETEQETRIENRVEQEAEPFEEIESVLSSSDRIGFNPLVSQSATDFLNPLTGERRETTLFQNE